MKLFTKNIIQIFVITFLFFFLGYCLIYSGKFPVMLSDAMEKRNLSIHDEDNNIVLIGGSSLLEQVNAELIKSQLNIDIVNLALDASAGSISYKMLLKNYIENNSKPETVILYLSPQHPKYEVLKSYSKITFLIRNGKITDFIKNKIGFNDIINTIINYYKRLITDIIINNRGSLHINSYYNEMKTYGGFSNYFNKEPFDNDCDFDSRLNKVYSLEYIKEFKNIFIKSVDNVYIYIAPMPDCDKGYNFYNELYQNISDNKIVTLSSNLFYDPTHMIKSGAINATRLLINFIETKK